MIDYIPTALVLAAFALHLLGERRAAVLTGRRRSREARRRAFTFYAGLAVVLAALQSPIDSLSAQLLWVHMIQHLLLLVVAAPLIVVGRPWLSLWRPLPLAFRRAAVRAALHARAFAPLRALFGALVTPPGAWLLYNANLIFWHLPGPYDVTLRNLDIHVVEHTLFLLTGILFWAQVLALAPARHRLALPARIAYVAAAIVPNVGLSWYLAFAQHPLYAPYAALAHRPGGISALADQQIGAGIMWGPGDVPYGIAISVLVQRWLAGLAATDTTSQELEQVGAR